MSDDTTVLSYHETLLRQSDVELLRGPRWLNDTVIAFYFEYLEKSLHADRPELLFVSPQVTQCLKMLDGGDDFSVFLDPLRFDERDFVFFALNDNDAAVQCGGSHWSLLLYSRKEAAFFYLDSLSDLVTDQACTLYANFLTYLDKKGNAGDDTKLVPLKTLQQSNAFDCGIHVLCNVDMLVKHVLENKTVSPDPPMADTDSVRTKRNDLLRLIEDLAKSSKK